MKSLDIKHIVLAGKRYEVPFTLQPGDGRNLLECEQVLRFVPGKRAVVFGQWNGQRIVAKLFFKPFVSKKHVQREIKGSGLLKKAGIDTADILYSGTDADENINILVFNALMPSKSLESIIEAGNNREDITPCLEKLMILIGKMHNAGLFHNDLHLNNFLLVSRSNTLYALDGAAVEEKKKNAALGMALSLKNLADVFARLKIKNNALFNALLNTYARTRGIHIDAERLGLLEKLIKKEERAVLNKYLKKMFRSSTRHICKRKLTSLVICRREFYTPAMKAFLNNPDAAFDVPEDRLLKAGNSSTVVRMFMDGKEMVVKRYNMKTWLHALRRAVIKSRAHISWYNSHMLLKVGISTPKPIAFKENRLGVFRNKAYFICDFIPGTSLRNYFKAAGSVDNRILEKIVQMVRIFKASRISHGDMKASNIILHENKPFLIDLDSMKQHKVSFFFTRAHCKDMKRFMKNWADQPELLHGFKVLFRENESP
ncbi:MAG: lipopolysaccharide kinase InaA family protein [Thermodesulfobacteriota bacterium]|nr:lipopolysaccharide kinase InaA family protein [Thermodesulfobacteriota bacterium]